MSKKTGYQLYGICSFVGGRRRHTVGDIFPHIIVIVGSFVEGFEYHVIGNGLKIGDFVYNTYKEAYDSAFLTL